MKAQSPHSLPAVPLLTADEVAAVRRILLSDAVWAAYMLADLQPEFLPQTRWIWQEAGDRPALILQFLGLEPPVLLTFGDETRLAVLLAQWAGAGLLPPEAYLSCRLEHEAVVARWYDTSRDRRVMVRMGLREVPAAPTELSAALQRLGPDDLADVETLLAHGGDFTPDGFAAYQLGNGLFFGTRDESGALLAMGGTHIVNWEAGIGTVGNMYTRPDARGQGHAVRILHTIVSGLHARGVTQIVLNVDTRNELARSIYRRHGFAEHCPFLEAVATRTSRSI